MVTPPRIELGIQPWEGCVLAAWPWGDTLIIIHLFKKISISNIIDSRMWLLWLDKKDGIIEIDNHFPTYRRFRNVHFVGKRLCDFLFHGLGLFGDFSQYLCHFFSSYLFLKQTTFVLQSKYINWKTKKQEVNKKKLFFSLIIFKFLLKWT